MIGQTLGHFRIQQRLGSGGMGVVYSAYDEKLHRTVAIKVVGRESGTPATDRARIIEEARAASGLAHPHICAVFETGEVDGQAYIAMEYVEGRPLSESIPHNGLSAEATVRLGIQIADALTHAHRRGVIHRDLKTANVVVSIDGRAKVLDFGLARRIPSDVGALVTRSSEAVANGTLVGTLSYMAPEVLMGQAGDERGDVWSVGVMLYEMAAGELPFKGRNEFDLSASILRAPPQPLPAHVPPMLRAIILRCLAKEPAQRYQQAGEIRAALEAIQSDIVAPADAAGRSPNVGPSDSRAIGLDAGPRSFRWWPAAAGLLMAAGAAAAVFLFMGRDARSPWERVASGGRLTLVVASDDPLFDPALSPDGKMLCYVAQEKDGRTDLFVRRVAGGGLVRVTNDDARESSPRFSPDGERIAFARRESAEGIPDIRVVPALGGDQVSIVAGAFSPRWSPDGRQIAFLKRNASAGADLAIADADGANARVLLPPDSTFPFLRDPAWAPDGREMAIVRGSGGIAGEIWLIRLDGGAPKRAMTDPPEVFSDAPAYTADGLGIVHSSNRGGATNIWYYPRQGGTPVRLTAGGGPDATPTAALSGAVTFINSRWRNTLDVYSLQGGPPRSIASHSPYIWGPAFSPDGQTIVFSRGEVDGSWHLWSVPVGRGSARRLSNTPGGEVYPRFDPTGSFIVFHTWGSPRTIGRLPIEGGVARMLNFGEGSDAFPDISPDGKWIAFTRTERDAERVYVAPVDGGTPRLLTTSPGAVPRWSPDGRSIAFGANRSYLGGISVINADGTGERRLTSVGGWPVWWPDGKEIGYLVNGARGSQEIHVVPLDGRPSRHVSAVTYTGSNYPFDVSRQGAQLATSNALHVSDEIWLLEPRAKP